ncbi:MAG: tRNA (5-methylaminomethyl-2-thiouridine)(34)-methyltransferase MnmD [Candidatus Woesearchaeota archaeon]
MYKKVETKDGSFTFVSPIWYEAYHSLTGAIEEAELKHLAPTKNYFYDGCVVLDFCFGLGYNTFAALDFARSQGFFVSVYALELDKGILDRLSEIVLPEKYEAYRKIFVAMLSSEGEVYDDCVLYTYSDDYFLCNLFLGDARDTIYKIEKNSVDIVYFDPFSPKKCPELWTADVFTSVFETMKANSVLTTYSCARKVRDAMRDVGFEVTDGPVVKRWAPATLGFKK